MCSNDDLLSFEPRRRHGAAREQLVSLGRWQKHCWFRLEMLVCSWIGHSREYYVGRTYIDRHGRLREKYYARCRRCGCGADCYNPGLLERLRNHHRELRLAVRRWWRTDCFDCRRPEIRLGRKTGDHDRCDQIPF